MSMEKEGVEALIKANNDNLLASFKGLLEQTVSQIKRSDEESAESQMKEIKRLKFNESHKFKKKANEDQFKFNQKLSETLDSAKSAAKNLQLEKVKTSLEEGETLISERQKHILLADKSDYGWDEYKKHSLADDSDDEKRIFKAESRARTFVNSLKKKKKSSAPAESTVSSQRRPIPALVPGFSPRPKPGTCFACGKPGHWRASCPTMAQQNTFTK
ncbi:serine/threonine-protein phosphatase 4 regulatory subunit 2-like [Pocillopora verrucosa]|uniref:serine/threonine-protein phosphatase 4 regulatory subunit 2-like n=1 Tax=Pocillopora verrucosa TaxID=203993 RepID=UPI003340C04E